MSLLSIFCVCYSQVRRLYRNRSVILAFPLLPCLRETGAMNATILHRCIFPLTLYIGQTISHFINKSYSEKLSYEGFFSLLIRIYWVILRYRSYKNKNLFNLAQPYVVFTIRYSYIIFCFFCSAVFLHLRKSLRNIIFKRLIILFMQFDR